MSGREWQRYLAPAAFLLAATIAVVLVRSGLRAGGKSRETTLSVLTAPRRHVKPTTTRPAPTTTPTKRQPAARRFWNVRAGDTFAVISAQSGIPVATLERLNPKVKTTSLFIGEKIRMR